MIESREITAVLLTVAKSFNGGMCSDILEPIWFKVYMTIDTIELIIFMLA